MWALALSDVGVSRGSARNVRVTRSKPVKFPRHRADAREHALVGAPRVTFLGAPLAVPDRLDLLQIAASTTAASRTGRRCHSTALLRVGDVSYQPSRVLHRPVARIGLHGDNKCEGQMFGVGFLSARDSVGRMMAMELAFGNFEHPTLAEVEVCSAKRVEGLGEPLFRCLARDGSFGRRPLERTGLALSVAILMAGDGRVGVTGHGGRSGMMCAHFARDCARLGPAAEACPMSACWVDDVVRSKAALKSYAREFHGKALAVVQEEELQGDSAEVAQKRADLLDELMDEEVPRALDFDEIAAPTGVAALLAGAEARFPGRRARTTLFGVVCDDDALPAAATPLLATDARLLVHAELRLLERGIRRARSGAGGEGAFATSLAAAPPADRARWAELSAADASLLAVAKAAAPRGAREAREACCAAADARPCRHLNLRALFASEAYNISGWDALSTLPPAQLAAMLQDERVSYECPLVAVRAAFERGGE